MGNPIIKGRNHNYSSNKLSLNSTSTNSFISDEKLRQQRKINSYKKLIRENKYHLDNLVNNNDKLILAEKNKIINLSSYSRKKDESENFIDLKLSQKIYMDKKFKNKNKLICLYTEYDSKINSKEKNRSINKNLFINENSKNYNKEMRFKCLKNTENNIQTKKYFNFNDINLFYINNKASLESSKFINFDIMKERTSFVEVLAHTNKTYLDKINKNHLIKMKENKSDKFFEIEFEDYIKKLNSEEFNIDRELKERPLMHLKNKYEIKLRLNSLNKIYHDKRKYSTMKAKTNKRKNNSVNSKSFINKKVKNKIKSLINTIQNKKMKSHKIILDEINKEKIMDKKFGNIYRRNDLHKNIYLNNSEYNYKSELSTSSNSKSKFLINNNINIIK